MHTNKITVITGDKSSGKTIVANALTESKHTLWIRGEEFANTWPNSFARVQPNTEAIIVENLPLTAIGIIPLLLKKSIRLSFRADEPRMAIKPDFYFLIDGYGHDFSAYEQITCLHCTSEQYDGEPAPGSSVMMFIDDTLNSASNHAKLSLN